MSKLSFRARALDATKPMPVYQKDELSDLQDYSVLNRAVPQMPSGMEKEEESEHHLQRAISAQQVYGDAKVMVIPVPEAEVSLACYNNLYNKKAFRLPKHYIHNQAQALTILEQEKPDYDMDSEDERWVKEANKRVGIDVSNDQFEEMIDRLEKSCGNQLVTLQEAKLLLKEDDDLIKAVYDYWTKKRLRNKEALIFQVRQERRDGSSTNDCYVAFRRRTEKMQTRKNRKNDESSYEKMLKLRRELSRAVTILEMVKRREKSKRELLHLTLEVIEKRFQLKDWDGKLFKSVKKELQIQRVRSHFRPLVGSSAQFRKKRMHSSSMSKNKPIVSNLPSISRGELDREGLAKKLKKKRQRQPISVGVSAPTTLSTQTSKPVIERLTLPEKTTTHAPHHPSVSVASVKSPSLSYQEVVDTMTKYEFPVSSDEETKNAVPGVSPSESFEAKKFPDGVFTFRRKPGCSYYSPRDDLFGEWPWMSDPKHRYSLTSLSVPDKCIGFVRRRMGRGGRVLLDRAYHPYSRKIEQLDLGKHHDHLPPKPELEDLLKEIKQNRWKHYRPSRNQHSSLKDNNHDEALPSWHSSQFNYDVIDSKPHSSNPGVHHKKHRSSSSKHPHKRSHNNNVAPELDKSSVAFAVSALVTVATPTPVVMTTSTNSSSKFSKVTSSVSQCKVSSNIAKSDFLTMQRCVTCGGIVTLTSTLTDSKTNCATIDTTTGQHKTLPVSLSLTTPAQQITGQRTTVLPATVTVSMSRAGGGTHTTGVPAILRINSSGALVGGTVIYSQQQTALVKTDDPSGANKHQNDVGVTLTGGQGSASIGQVRRTFNQRSQRSSVNVNLALPATVLASINNETAGLRATQSAPSSPKSFQSQSNDGNSGSSVKACRAASSKTINLNLGNLTTSQAQPFISTNYATSVPVNQVLNAGRITIAGNMLKLGSGTVFSVALPQTSKASSMAASSSTATLSGDNTLVVNDGNIVLTKMEENRNKTRIKTFNEQSNLKPMTLTTLNPTLKKPSATSRPDDIPVNHTVQINVGSPAKGEPGSSTNILDPLSTVVTVANNTVPVKSSKTSRPMEVT